MEIATLYTEFHRALLTYIKSKTSSREDAEDILHNVFLKITSGGHSLEDKQSIRNWVFIVTRNAIVDYYRRKGKTTMASLETGSAQQIIDEDEKKAIESLSCCLLDMIGRLPEEYRAILVDSELKGISQKELAEKYDMAYSSLRSRVQRGRDRLKKVILDCCLITSDTRGGILDVIPRNPCGDGNPC